MTKIFSTTILLSAILVFGGTAHCGQVWQYGFEPQSVAMTNGGMVVECYSLCGPALAPLHGGTNSWATPSIISNAVFFGGTSTPLAFPDAATQEISRVFIVATATNTQDHATLLFGKSSLWLQGGSLGWALDMDAAEIQTNGAAAASVSAIRSYLALRWSLPLDVSSPPDAYASLKRLGMNTHGLYRTLLLML